MPQKAEMSLLNLYQPLSASASAQRLFTTTTSPTAAIMAESQNRERHSNAEDEKGSTGDKIQGNDTNQLPPDDDEPDEW